MKSPPCSNNQYREKISKNCNDCPDLCKTCESNVFCTSCLPGKYNNF